MKNKKTLLPILLFFMAFTSVVSAQSFHVYVSDAGNFNSPPWKILKFDQNGQNGTIFINHHLSWPQDLVFLEEDTTLLVSNLNTGTITKFHSETGAWLGEFAEGIGGPTRMEIGPDTLLYVLQWNGNGKVKRYRLDGTYVDDFTSVGVSNSIGLDWDAEGNLYVSSYNGKFVRKFGPDGADLGKIISTNLVGPTNLWIAENGDIMVCDYSGGAVKRFSATGNFIGNFIYPVPQVEGVDFMPNGHILLGVGGSLSVKEYTADGMFVGNFIGTGASGLQTPNAVVIRLDKTTGVASLPKTEMTFVQPTIGNKFQILPLESGEFPIIEVYSHSGIL